MKKLRTLLYWLLGLGLVALCGAVALPVVEVVALAADAQRLAYALVPAPYPGSELVNSYRSGASASMNEHRMYRTPDPPESVYAFMEAQMPGFERIEDLERGLRYRNEAVDRSARAKPAAELACSSLYCAYAGEAALTYPGVVVELSSDPASSGTLIKVSIWWPAP